MIVYRRVAVVYLTGFAALLTPPDPFSLLLGSIALVLLYEGALRMAAWAERRRG